MNSPFFPNQPAVFPLACLTSMCERFGFYSLSFLLVLYLKETLLLNDAHAFLLFGVFNGLCFITPAIGGYLADNFFGIRRSILLGLGLEGVGLNILSVLNKSFLPVGLSLIIIGVGLFRTGPTNLMARSYQENDSRIDGGFTLFYMAINIGSFCSSLAVGLLQRYYGWEKAFLVGAIALYIGIILYLILRHTASQDDSDCGKKTLSFKKWLALFGGVILSFFCFIFLLQHLHIANDFFFLSAILIAAYFIYEILRSPKEEKIQIAVCLFLILTGLIFFLLYFQLYTSIDLFIDRSVVHKVFNLNLPTPSFLSLNAFWILILSPILVILYNHLGKKGKDLSVTTKFPLGILITSFCFFSLQLGIHFASHQGKVSSIWIVVALFFYSLGELLISALGVAMVTKIAPKRMYGVMMGAWFLIATALASSLSAKVATLANIPKTIHDSIVTLQIYNIAFFKMGLIGTITAILVFIINTFYINKLSVFNN